MSIKLRLINEFAIEVDGAITHRLRTRKTEELVAFLAIHSSRWVSRSEIVDQIWEGDDEQTGRRKLRLALHSIRSVIGNHLETNGDLIRISDVVIDFESSTLSPGWRLMPEHSIEWLDQWAAGEQARRQISSLKNLGTPAADENLLEELANLIQVDPTEPDLYRQIFEQCISRGAILTAKLAAGIARTHLGRHCPAELAEYGTVRVRSDYFGRFSELAILTQGLLGQNEPAAMTLVGLGGIGKSRLAQELVHLAPEEDIPTTWVSLYGIETASEAEDRFRAAVCSLLAISELEIEVPENVSSCLVVMDNADSLPETGLDFLQKWLVSGSGLRVLVTTQRGGHIVGRQIPLSTLSIPSGESESHAQVSDSYRLLVQQSGVAESPENLPALIELTRLAGGIPLALKMIAAECRSKPVNTVLEGLKSTAFQLKFGGESQVSNRRHFSLESTLEWSFSLLSEEQRGALMKLSHLQGEFHDDVVKALSIEVPLDDLSWVTQNAQYHSRNLLPPIRQFLRQKSPELHDEVERELAGFLTRRILDCYPLRYGEVLPVAEVHHADLASLYQSRARLGLTHQETGALLIGIQFTAARNGRIDMLIQGLEEVLESADEPMPVLRNLLGSTKYLDGRFEAAAEDFLLQAEHPDPDISGVAKTNLALVYHSLGRSAEALSILEQTIAATAEVRRKNTRILNRGSVLAGMGRFDEALNSFVEAEFGFQGEPGLRPHEVLAVHRKAEVLTILGRTSESRIFALECLEFCIDSDHWHHICELYGLLLYLSAVAGEKEDVKKWWDAVSKSRSTVSTQLAYAALALHALGRTSDSSSLCPAVLEKELKDFPKMAAKELGIKWSSVRSDIPRKTWLSAANQLMKRL